MVQLVENCFISILFIFGSFDFVVTLELIKQQRKLVEFFIQLKNQKPEFANFFGRILSHLFGRQRKWKKKRSRCKYANEQSFELEWRSVCGQNDLVFGGILLMKPVNSIFFLAHRKLMCGLCFEHQGNRINWFS